MAEVSLTLLDLAAIPEGGSAADTIAASIALAQDAEQWGYQRYWLAEHHLTAGLAAVSPVSVLAAIAGRTSTIRIGSGATLTGHRTALSIAEDFATLAALAPGRVDLGFGRSAARGRDASTTRPAAAAVAASPRFARRLDLLQQSGAVAADHGDLVRDVLRMLEDEYVDADGEKWNALVGGGEVEVWSLGSSAGESAQLAGDLGLPFAVNHHMSPSTAEDAVQHYRAAFTAAHPGLAARVAVAAEVCIAQARDQVADRRAAHAEWIARQRRGLGILPFPTSGAPGVIDDPQIADRMGALVAGAPSDVAADLRALASRFEADEVIVSILDHELARRAETHRLLAEAWFV
ncbi:MsnO8 family LLM class oxidoreductase [Microbacterium gilvum]|uniref:LLM class flavin-dependent oxidoreductase n=1 Tax=Microbacterium gilvum TaxID=1336204 RepID=A0ABP8ZVV3_9MICO